MVVVVVVVGVRAYHRGPQQYIAPLADRNALVLGILARGLSVGVEVASGATYGVIVPSLLVDHLPDAITHLSGSGLPYEEDRPDRDPYLIIR